MATIQIEVVSAEAPVFSGQATFVTLPGIAGELGILPGHIPLLTTLRPGVVSIQTADQQEETIYVAGGILEVQPHSITVLTDTAIRGQDIDEAKAQEARRRAEETLQNTSANLEYATAQAELSHATAQLAAIARLRKIKR